MCVGFAYSLGRRPLPVYSIGEEESQSRVELSYSMRWCR
jgi:hypothetical protein